jgi:hypothetical protein
MKKDIGDIIACTDKKENQIFLIYKEIQSGEFMGHTNTYIFRAELRLLGHKI